MFICQDEDTDLVTRIHTLRCRHPRTSPEKYADPRSELLISSSTVQFMPRDSGLQDSEVTPMNPRLGALATMATTSPSTECVNPRSEEIASHGKSPRRERTRPSAKPELCAL